MLRKRRPAYRLGDLATKIQLWHEKNRREQAIYMTLNRFKRLADLRDDDDESSEGNSEFLTGEAWCPNISVAAVEETLKIGQELARATAPSYCRTLRSRSTPPTFFKTGKVRELDSPATYFESGELGFSNYYAALIPVYFASQLMRWGTIYVCLWSSDHSPVPVCCRRVWRGALPRTQPSALHYHLLPLPLRGHVWRCGPRLRRAAILCVDDRQ